MNEGEEKQEKKRTGIEKRNMVYDMPLCVNKLLCATRPTRPPVRPLIWLIWLFRLFFPLSFFFFFFPIYTPAGLRRTCSTHSLRSGGRGCSRCALAMAAGSHAGGPTRVGGRVMSAAISSRTLRHQRSSASSNRSQTSGALL